MTTVKEATFRHQFLTTDKVEVLLAQLHNLKALNLSQNKMNMLPRGIPSSLTALDLSYNLFATFPLSEKLHNLIELKLSNNSIESTAGLASAVSLQYLDLSHNRIKTIIGLESMKNLKSLQLEGNMISSPSALRSLSFNRNLLDLVLEGNPIALLKNYKTIVLGFVLSLKKLDGERCKGTKSDGGTYADTYSYRRNTSDMTEFDSKIGRSNSAVHSPRGRHFEVCDSNTSGTTGESIFVDGWCSNTTYEPSDPFAPARTRSPLPWRNPPSVVPRDRKGNSVFSAIGQCSTGDGSSSMSTMVRRFASADSSPLRGGPTTATRAFDSTLRGFYGSPGEATAKGTGERMHLDTVGGDLDSPGVHQWSSPSLATNAALKRMQSDEKILRRLSATLDLSSRITRTPSVTARDAAKTLLSDPAVKAVGERGRAAVKSKGSSIRGRSADRRVDTFNASDRSASPARQRTLQEAQGVRVLVGDGVEGEGGGGGGGQTEDNHFESEREASYLNKHLGISTAEELWHDELIEEAMSLSAKSSGKKSSGTSVATTTEGFESVNLSPTLQNKSSVLRAVFTAEAIRKRNLQERDDKMRRRSPSPLRRNKIDWDHHHSGGKTPPYHRSNFFKATQSESERNAELEAERDYKNILSKGCDASLYSEEQDESLSLNLKKKEFSRAESVDFFDSSMCRAQHNISMNPDNMGPVLYGNHSDADTHKASLSLSLSSPSGSYLLSSTGPHSPPHLRAVSPVQKCAHSSPPLLNNHFSAPSRPHSPAPDGRAMSPPHLRAVYPPQRPQSPPRLHYNAAPSLPVQSRPLSPPPQGRAHSPPQLRPASPLRSTSPPRLNHHTYSPPQKRSPSPDRIHYHSSNLLRPHSPSQRAHSPVQARAQSPTPQLRALSPFSKANSDSSDSADNTDVGNHSRSPTQNRVPMLNKGKSSSARHSQHSSPSTYTTHSSRLEDSGATTRSHSRSVSPHRSAEPNQVRRKQIYETALMLHENPQAIAEDFFGDFKYLERLLTEAGDGSIEVRRLKTVMRTIMESRKESLQLLQSAINTSSSSG